VRLSQWRPRRHLPGAQRIVEWKFSWAAFESCGRRGVQKLSVLDALCVALEIDFVYRWEKRDSLCPRLHAIRLHHRHRYPGGALAKVQYRVIPRSVFCRIDLYEYFSSGRKGPRNFERHSRSLPVTIRWLWLIRRKPMQQEGSGWHREDF
jgi:hypothetical protein